MVSSADSRLPDAICANSIRLFLRPNRGEVRSRGI